MIIKRPAVISKKILVSLLVITLTTVISSAQAGSVSEQDKSQAVAGGSESSSVAQVMPKVADVGEQAKVHSGVPLLTNSPASPDLVLAKSGDVELKAPKAGEQQQELAKSAAPEVVAAAPSTDSVVAHEKPADGAALEANASAESSNEASRRKGRAELSSSSPAPATTTADAGKATPAPEKATAAAAAEKPAAERAQVKLEPKVGLSKASKPQPLIGKSGSKSKLPANLGTVTSTGSGGPAHYMSKHDAYSAIAEKHGALAQDALRKSDKRSQIQGFGGIQKASGLGDMFSPFKGVSDSGLARTLGASMRSIMKNKYSVPAYVASALLGAVALMAFYESPISPLPVPPLPEPPVGRFPPEMPNLSPNTQVPFRTNQQQQQFGQQNYNQRSYNGLPQQQQQQQQQFGNFLQQPQQVLFPGSHNQAQQRQMTGPGAAPTVAAGAGPVQQIAANLLSSVGKQQISQRKSSPDFELQSISRSLFSSGSLAPSPKMSGPANQQKPNSFLSFFGLGSGSAPAQSTAPTNGEVQQASAAAVAAGGNSPTGSSTSGTQSASSTEQKNQAAVMANGLSNSHLVNKVKSYFSRAVPGSSPSSSSSSSISSNSNPYDQYQRMSFVQALMKDTAFLPAFLTTNRKSSSSSLPTSSQSSAINKQSTSSSSSSGNNGPAARMQVDEIQSSAGTQNQPQATSNSKAQRPTSSSYGLVRTADRIAHALLETFTSGIAQRSIQSGSSTQSADGDDKKSSLSNEDNQGNQAASLASSLIGNLVSSYSANAFNSMVDQGQQQSQPETAKSAQQQQSSNQQIDSAASQMGPSARSASNGPDEDQSAHTGNTHTSNKQQQIVPSSAQSNHDGSTSSSAAHVRKTRSIGFEYPVEKNNQELAIREQQPSKAAQINNVIDFVADSYTHNRLLFNFVMNQVGLSQAVPYVEQILASGGSDHQ